jgi:hypothetical protein
MLEFSVLTMLVCSSDELPNFCKLSSDLKAKGPPWWWAFGRRKNLPIQQKCRSVKCLF